ncbi:MAG: glycosyltransferase family 4 protein, partial [Actinobacteria bacterium]|nr:glycosyltransferase family 4 protein [Actinomycetota bacterium]
MRVALACPYDWDAQGGVQVHVRQLAAHLRARGHQVLTLAPGGRLGVRAGEPDVRIVARPLRVPYQGTVAPIAPSPLSLARVRTALRAFRPDVVHVHEPLVPSTSMAAALVARSPVVATFHAHAERSGLFDRAAPLLRPVWRRLDLRLAVSEAAASFVGDRMGDRPRVVPNGVDVRPFATATPAPGVPEGRPILWVGRLDRQKGFPVAVGAFADVAAGVPDAVLLVAGDGADRGAVDRLPADVRARVVMLGSVPHDRLPGYHAAAELFVAPALGQESFGIVLVEAMAAGLPVIASDIA